MTEVAKRVIKIDDPILLYNLMQIGIIKPDNEEEAKSITERAEKFGRVKMVGVLYSINRPHTDNIKSGRKLWEIRKSKPNIPVPFPAFIYETKKKGGCGKVIGEFVCDRIIETIPDYNPKLNKFFNYDFYDENGKRLEDCLTDEEKQEYGKGKPLYGLHISNLKIYDKPKELNEFRKPCNDDINNCKSCVNRKLVKADVGSAYLCCRDDYLNRPPQSMCYVEAQT